MKQHIIQKFQMSYLLLQAYLMNNIYIYEYAVRKRSALYLKLPAIIFKLI